MERELLDVACELAAAVCASRSRKFRRPTYVVLTLQTGEEHTHARASAGIVAFDRVVTGDLELGRQLLDRALEAMARFSAPPVLQGRPRG